VLRWIPCYDSPPESFPIPWSKSSLEEIMKKIAGLPLMAVLIFAGAATIFAQDAGGPPKPGPEHAKLGFFVGKWSSEGDLKPGPYGPGGKFTFTEDCDWLSGNFAVLCHSDGQLLGMSVKGLSVMSYNPEEKAYVYFESNNMGENTYSKGTVDGDTWTWKNDALMNGKTVHSQFTLKQLSGDSASYKYEMGDPLALIMEGKQTRQK
jgi:hypothetical protein